MKKFISMLAGVVMASTMFAASAYAENYWSMTVSPTEVNEGDIVTVVLATAEKTLGADMAEVYYDGDAFELVDIKDDAGESYTSEDCEFLFARKNYFDVKANDELKCVTFVWASTGENKTMSENEEFATITFKAIAATEGSEFKLKENCAVNGADIYNDFVPSETEVVVVKGNEPEPPVDNNNYGKAGNEFEGKATKYWTVDFAEWTGAADVSLTDGTTTKTIDVTTADDSEYDIAGAVSFYVYVIGDAAAIENVYIVE